MIRTIAILILFSLCSCSGPQRATQQAKQNPQIYAPGMVNDCLGKSIITPTSFGYTYTNPCSGAFGAGTNGVTVTEIQTHPLKGPHQFATSLAGPWSTPASNSYVWKWSGPYKHSPMYFKGPPGAVTIISYWSRTNVPEVSYLVANS